MPPHEAATPRPQSRPWLLGHGRRSGDWPSWRTRRPRAWRASGVEGAEPLVSPVGERASRGHKGVSWLEPPNSASASPGTPPKHRSPHRPKQPRPGRRCKLLDLLVASITDGEGEQADRLLVGDGGTFCRTARLRPTRTPRDLEVVDPGPFYGPYPLRNNPKRPPSPVAGSNQAPVSPRLPAVGGAGEGEVRATKTLLEAGDRPVEGLTRLLPRPKLCPSRQILRTPTHSCISEVIHGSL